MLQQYLRVLLTKDNTGSLKLSIDNATDNVKAILKDIEGPNTFHPAPFEVYSPTYQEARKAEYTGGKAGIGPFALNNAHHILTQLTKLHMVSNDFTEAMGITDVSRIFDVPTEHNPRGGRILDWLSAMINAFVDIAKDPYIVRLNVNAWTYNMVSFLLRTGKGKDTFYFMYQPILREMAQEVLKTKGKYGVDRTKTPSQLENEAIERVLDKYDPNKSRRKKYAAINKDNKQAAMIYSELFMEQELNINGKVEHTNLLRQAIKDPMEIGEFNDFQVKVYYAWKALKPYADSLANLVKYSKIDTKKIGKTFAEQLNYYDGMQRLLDDPNFEPGAIRRFYDETFVGHKTDNAILFGSSIFSNKLLRNTQLFSNQKDAVLGLLGRKGLADASLLKAIIAGMEAQIKSRFFTQFARDNSIDITKMFTGKMSMAKRLNNFKEFIRSGDSRMSHLIDNNGNFTNDFLEFLLPNIQNTDDNVDGLDFIDTSELLNVDQAKANNLINYWRELIEDPNPYISKLFKDLAVYAFIIGGDNPVMNGFFQYLPNSYRIAMGYRDFIRNVLDQFSNGSTLGYADKDDFFRNNWTNDKLVKPVAYYTRKGVLETIQYNSTIPNMIAGVRNGEIAIRPNNWVDIQITRPNGDTYIDSYPIFPPYIKYNDGFGNNPQNWHLYTLVGYGTNEDGAYYPVYGLIGKKGYRHRGHTVTEYGVQTQFSFNRETEWNYTEAVNNPDQLASMSSNPGVWSNIKSITDLASYQNYNYMQQNPQTVIEEDVENGEAVLEEKDEPDTIQTQQSTQTINIYARTNENADLSNFAIRPFTHLGIQFQSVEQAFQFYKTEFSPKNEYNRAVGQAIMMSTSDKDLRRLGRQFKGLNKDAWDQMAPTIMKQLILDSFEQNPEAVQRLLSTGNATLTHIQDKDRWRTEFPRILMEVREELRQRTINNPNDYTMHSGGAVGADSVWGQIAEEFGIPNTPGRQNHYYNNQPTPKGNIQISQEDYEEGRYKVAKAAKANWGYQYATMKDDRLIRNWSQVKHSDAVFAIGHIVNKGDRIFPNQKNDTRIAQQPAVTGGTGYAVEMAIQADKPVYVYDQVRKQWYSNVDGKWSKSDIPTLTRNFAGIGTREINQDGINAIRSVFEKTFSTNIPTSVEQTHNETLEVLGGVTDPIANSEMKDAIEVAQQGITFESALSTVKPIFTQEEINQIKQGLNGRNLKVMSVSRYTDPAFFAKEIVKFLEENAKKPFTDPTRVNVIELWTKHDGEPIQEILQACKKYKVAPMVSFSITTLGNTPLEQGVLEYKTLLDLIKKLVESGDLDPRTTTIRIDPLLPGYTNIDNVREVVNIGKSMGIRKYVTSLVQSYGYLDDTVNDRKVTSGINSALARIGQTYDWDKYYGRIPYGKNQGKINFKPKQEYIDEIGNVLLDINKDPEIELQTCSFTINGLKASACLDPLIIERVTGVSVTRPDGTYERDTSRPECMCYGCHGDKFRWNEKQCFSSCAYCYAAHSGDNNFQYYNSDGTLKDRPLTRVSGQFINDNQLQQEIRSVDNLVTTDWHVVDFMVKYDRAVKKIDPILDQLELTSDQRNTYYKEFSDMLQEEHDNGNLNTQEDIDGVVNKFICNL